MSFSVLTLSGVTVFFFSFSSREVDDAELCRLEGVRDKLVCKIILGIEDEITLILNELRSMKNLVEVDIFLIKNYLHFIERAWIK